MADLPEAATIRPAQREDAEAVRAVGRASWHAAYDDVLGAERVDETIDEWWDLPGLRRAIDDEDSVFLVAEADTAARATAGDDAPGVDGLVAAAYGHPDRGEAGVYELSRIYVHPDCTGEGLGGALLDRLRERLPKGTERLRLVVLAENEDGVAFYESYGFERVDSRVVETDGETHEEYVYELSV
jgi:ribosomal protein S18 acetylase RimI-like enzyme